MEFYTIGKLALLVFAVWFWTVIVGKMVRDQPIPAILLALASATLVGFVYMQGWLS